MSINPAVNKATTVLSEDMDKATTTFVPVTTNTEPEPTATNARATSRWKLYRNGSFLGWLGRDENNWARLVPSQEYSLNLEHIQHNGVNYYRIHVGAGKYMYMSVSDRAYVGFYNWSGATGFTKVGNGFRSDYNNQDLSYDDKEDGYLTCWNTYARLEVFR